MLAKTEMLLGRQVWTLLLVTLMTLSLMLAAQPTHAQTNFTVTRIDDFADPNPGDGECGFFAGRGGQVCTLRAAIEEANATAGADTINFNIVDGGDGVKTISPTSELPAITEAVTIDGYTQPGASPNTLAKGTNANIMIELDGSFAESASGLEIEVDDVVVRGLAIGSFDNSFQINGVEGVGDPSGVKIEGNFIGTDASGTVVRANKFNGINWSDSAGNNIIGGTTPATRNLISGGNSTGVQINAVEGGVVIAGNLIGTQKDGRSPLGNRNGGVAMSGSSGNTVGGATAAAANTIAFNGLEGVEIRGDNSSANRLLSNSIFSNGGLGIDLEGGTENAEEATKNDPLDADEGTNGLQNKPAVTSTVTSGKTTIKGKLLSKPNKTFVVRFFANPSGQNEGKQFIGQKKVTTNSAGKVSFTFVPSRRVGAGKTVTATATGTEGTSEFSAPRTVVAQ